MKFASLFSEYNTFPDGLTGWVVRRIPVKDAQEISMQCHYLHRKAPCSVAFGLLDPNEVIRGVILYGTPASAPLRSGIAGNEESLNVIELTRLWVDDAAPKNGESFLIGRSIRQCGKEIVVSFADMSFGHIGTVYQASNFLYTGLSAKRTSWTVRGAEKHGHTWADKFTAVEMRHMFGDKFSLEERSRKHRYIYINAKGKRHSEILSNLKYPILPYHKITDAIIADLFIAGKEAKR